MLQQAKNEGLTINVIHAKVMILKVKGSRDQYACYKKYGNKLKSMTAEIGLIYSTKSKISWLLAKM